MRYVIFGTGGIGGYFGGRLAQSGEDVWFVGRGKHLEALSRQGLRIKSTAGDFTIPPGKMVEDIAAIGRADVVLICVKSYDTESAAQQISALLHDNSLVISLQNGIDNEEKISRIIDRGTVYGGVAYISARITAPGEITESGGFQRIVFGPMSGAPDHRAQEIQERMIRAGIKSRLEQNITKELWKKFIFIASTGSLTALSRLTHGEILASDDLRSLMFDAMREIQAIAWKLDIDVDPVDEEKVLEGLNRFDPGTRSSMYHDLISQRPMEIEALNGTVVRYGENLGVPTPIHRVIYSVLLPYHQKYSQRRSTN